MSSSSLRMIVVAVLLAIAAWLFSFFLLDNLNPLLLLMVLFAYSVGLLVSKGENSTRTVSSVEPQQPPSPLSLQEAETLRRLELVLDGTSDGVWDWDMRSEGGRVHWSDRAHLLLKLERDQLGDNFDVLKSIMHPEDRDEFNKLMRKHILFKTPFHLEVRIRQRATDLWRYFLIRGKARFDDQNQPVQMAGSISDITERKRAQEELNYNAYHDSLTRLHNRSWFLEDLAKTVRQTSERTDDRFALLLVNIDNFKQINDNLGTQKGDEILLECTRRFHTIFLDDGLLFRIGADEFAFILKDIRQAGEATRLANLIRVEFSRPFIIDTIEYFLTASIGIVFSDEETRSPEQLLQDANTVLAQAKAKGGNCIEVFTTKLREQEKRRYGIVYDLQMALEKEQFYLTYQPLINLQDHTLGGFEALLRWNRPGYKDIPPSEFIPIAEQTKEILKIGEWVLRTACAQAKSWVECGHPNLVMSVNVSAPQFSNQDVADVVRRALQETKLEARHLKIEITESVAMNEVEKTTQTLIRLQQMGVGVAIDDFGTGYSSLSYLKKYPITALKIDKYFVQDLPHSDSVAIVTTVISMAQSLNYAIVAEGVETEEQREFLKEKGVHQVQGFLYSKPLKASEVESDLLKRWGPAQSPDGVSRPSEFSKV